MFERIRQNGKPALKTEDREFIEKLAQSDIWILAVGLRGAPAITSISHPDAFEVIAAHRIDVAEVGDDDSVFPFNYATEGGQALPFFTTEERAKKFAGQLIKEAGIFQPYSLMSGFVAPPENDAFQLILDPLSAEERVLSKEERLLLRSITSR